MLFLEKLSFERYYNMRATKLLYLQTNCLRPLLSISGHLCPSKFRATIQQLSSQAAFKLSCIVPVSKAQLEAERMVFRLDFKRARDGRESNFARGTGLETKKNQSLCMKLE